LPSVIPARQFHRVTAPTLLLWDIDGTLILSGHAGERALIRALKTLHGVESTLADIDYAGRTDRWIARAVLHKHGLPAGEADITRYLEIYLQTLPLELANPQARTLPGVREILTQVAGLPQVAQGLLTGNLQRGAELKLAHHDLWSFFRFGAFADDAELRNDLGPHALRRAQAASGQEFSPERVFIIGDTPHDIACGRAIGAHTIAVATGHYRLEQLETCRPTAAFPDLSDAAAFLRTVGL
jgi:phosphoglycolate phosphatase-like HAD superfamily hydrolase